MRDDFVERCADRLRSAGYRYPDEMAQSLVRAGLSAETSAGGLATEEEWARAMDQVLTPCDRGDGSQPYGCLQSRQPQAMMC